MGGRSKRQWYHVRIREDGVKKSRFYLETEPKAAASCYKGSGTIMWVEKASKERFLGVGKFFRLGDELLREFASSSTQATSVLENRDKEKVRGRRSFNKSRKDVVS